jgi:geranylgeranyl transferase type-1 subunit beta
MGELRNEENSIWDPANVPATFFALAILAILKDDFSRVRRRECLLWLTKMQRPDGSFGETLGGGKIEGGLDPRFGYLAMGIRAILLGRNQGELEDVSDLDIEAFVKCIRRSQVRYKSPLSRKKMLKCSSAMTADSQSHLSMNRMVRINLL